MDDQQSRRGDQQPDQDLPGSVSDQNAEEQPGPGAAQSGRKDPRGSEGGSSGGESGEGSQSTGHPDSAG
ncbi:MAG TPA: hypothetical protein VF781_11290 [Solirubrobacteraceae bacterium]